MTLRDSGYCAAVLCAPCYSVVYGSSILAASVLAAMLLCLEAAVDAVVVASGVVSKLYVLGCCVLDVEVRFVVRSSMPRVGLCHAVLHCFVIVAGFALWCVLAEVS